MERRLRRYSSPNNTAAYLRYLKPGALAQLRDSRISASRTHRVTKSLFQAQICASTLRSSAAASPGSPTQTNWPPSSPKFLSGRICGPCCPQRKKLMAARAVFISSPNFSGTVPDSPGQRMDLFGGSENSANNNILVAH
ncbi:unnamed protein product [Fraxinus pennsylvanica]|uniref:Uncharacterized protein n=1 Tax=Fraxinus pennsylvanica TaxID=56036 RepID=A0AAD1ZNW3_9LAMI|nr:unnamed protein product [Fraxinus pennsylvanica]